MVYELLKVVEEFEKDGIFVEVVDFCIVSLFDIDIIIVFVEKIGCVIVV